MPSLLSISNIALRALGVVEILSLTQQGKAADRCSSAVVGVVKTVLRAHHWSFATKWSALAKLSTPPPFGYDYAYQLPAGTVKLIDARQIPKLNAPRISYELIEDEVLYTDADPCYARVIRYVESKLSNMPADCEKACGHLLAAEIAAPLAKSDKQPGEMQLYEFFLNRAMLSDSTSVHEEPVDQNQTCTLLAARDFPQTDDDGGF